MTESESTQWLWPGYIPRGKLTILTGALGSGKTLLSLDIAARVSSGMKWPDNTDGVSDGKVVLINSDDGLADTIRPTLGAADAYLANIVWMNPIGDIFDAIRRYWEHAHLSPTLIIIDPLESYLDRRIKRTVINELNDLARDLSIAIIATDYRLDLSILGRVKVRPAVLCIGTDPPKGFYRLNNDGRVDSDSEIPFTIERHECGSAIIRWYEESTND